MRVVERGEERTEMTGWRVERSYLVHEEYAIQSVTYVVENTTSRLVIIQVEAPIRDGFEVFNTPPATIATATDRRWEVKVSARNRVEFSRHERHRTLRSEELLSLELRELQRFLQNKWLDQSMYDRLSGMLDRLGKIEQARREKVSLTDERKGLYEQQEQLRANLQTLNATGQEATLRSRMLGQLEERQNRLEEIEERMRDLTREMGDLEKQFEQIMGDLK